MPEQVAAAARRVVVTGASSGIGAATVRLFRTRGWDVVGVARRTDRLQALAEETGASVFTADVTSPHDVEALRQHLESTGPVSGTTGTFSMGSYDSIGYMTDFDQPANGQWLSSNEAQGSLGDSGGSAFDYSGGEWYLSGIFSAVAGFTGQAANTSAFGNLSILTSVASYSDAISSSLGGATLIPEASFTWLSLAGCCLFLKRRR